jgi:hypothetical protein
MQGPHPIAWTLTADPPQEVAKRCGDWRRWQDSLLEAGYADLQLVLDADGRLVRVVSNEPPARSSWLPGSLGAALNELVRLRPSQTG